jgi:hypothetical protein
VIQLQKSVMLIVHVLINLQLLILAAMVIERPVKNAMTATHTMVMLARMTALLMSAAMVLGMTLMKNVMDQLGEYAQLPKYVVVVAIALK